MHRCTWTATTAIAGLTLLLAAPISTTNAATQGTQGATSDGSLVITLTIDSLVSLTRLDDIALSYTNGVVQPAQEDVCVWWNTPGGYTVTADGLNEGGGADFALKSANDESVEYNVAWSETVGGGQTSLARGTAEPFTPATLPGAVNCNNSDNASVYVSLPSDAAALTQGTYTDTLTLLITPQ